jgi:hypothetical protein
VLKKSNQQPVPPRSRRGLWALAVLDAMTATWMLTVGDWFDTTSRLTAVLTLGGHHVVVLVASLAGFVMLAAIATATGGFAETSPVERVLIGVAGAVSVIALAGVLSIVALVAAVVLILVLLGRAFVRR